MRKTSFVPSVPKRMPIIELRDMIKASPGWDLDGDTLQYLDLAKAFREAAHEGAFEVWGRPASKRGLFASDQVLTKIPRKHWSTATLDMLKFPAADKNEQVCSHIIDIGVRNRNDTYFDLEVERLPAIEWARNGAAKYRGEEDSKRK